MQTLGEAIQASSTRNLSLSGPNRLVKVLGCYAEDFMRGVGHGTENETPDHLTGYVTVEKALYGLSSDAIERVLGLRSGELRPFAYVYSLARLPEPHEIEYKLSAAFPDGEAADYSTPGSAAGAALEAAREAYAQQDSSTLRRSYVPVVQHYGPGAAAIPQWRLTKPIPVGQLIAQVSPVIPFPRSNGSIKPWTPHNRGEAGAWAKPG